MGLRPARSSPSASASCSSASARRTSAASPTSSTASAAAAGTPSVDKPLKRTQQNPKDAQAWSDLATAYDAKRRLPRPRSPPGSSTRRCAPKDADGLHALAGDYQQQFDAQTNDAALAQTEAQSAQATNFGPPSDLAARPRAREHARPDRLGGQPGREHTLQRRARPRGSRRPRSSSASTRSSRSSSRPSRRSSSSSRQQAQTAGDTPTAIAAYKRFLKLAPDDPSAPQVKAQLKAAEGAVNRSSSSSRRLDSRADGDNTISASSGVDRRELRHQDGATRRATGT